MLKAPVTVIVPIFNEEIHLRRFFERMHPLTEDICLVDSFSTDASLSIAKNFGARILQNQWIDYATQFNWALRNFEIRTPWVMRMDADEYLTDELVDEIRAKLASTPPEVSGYVIKRRVVFLNRFIKHGGTYPQELLRIWRTGEGELENRHMDEHVILNSGQTCLLEHDMVDHNLNSLGWWIDKHNKYASRELMDLMALEENRQSERNIEGNLGDAQASRKRWVKERLYSRMPLFIRAAAYFAVRYTLLLGFLDGTPGLIWHFLQGFWYRFLVDAKIYEKKFAERNARD